jgi:hypothetical protein
MSGGSPEFVALSAAQEGRPVPVAFPNDTQIVTEGRNTLVTVPAGK